MIVEPILEESVAYDAADDAPVPVAQVQNRIATKVAESPALIKKTKVALRNFFPENWLFELMTTREDSIKR